MCHMGRHLMLLRRSLNDQQNNGSLHSYIRSPYVEDIWVVFVVEISQVVVVVIADVEDSWVVVVDEEVFANLVEDRFLLQLTKTVGWLSLFMKTGGCCCCCCCCCCSCKLVIAAVVVAVLVGDVVMEQNTNAVVVIVVVKSYVDVVVKVVVNVVVCYCT